MPTPDPANARTRDGHGRFRREVASVERDARACKLISQGWTYEAVAVECGYSDRGTAYRAVQWVLVETARAHGTEDLREMQINELSELRRVMWGVVNDPPPLTDRLGRIVRDGDGEDAVTVPDVQAQAAAAQVILRCAERLARLKGMDAPRRSITFTADMDAARGAELRAQLGIPADVDEAELFRLLSAPGRRVLPGAAEAG